MINIILMLAFGAVCSIISYYFTKRANIKEVERMLKKFVYFFSIGTIGKSLSMDQKVFILQECTRGKELKHAKYEPTIKSILTNVGELIEMGSTYEEIVGTKHGMYKQIELDNE